MIQCSHLRLLEAAGRPGASDLLPCDRPDLSGRGRRARDGARDDINDGADRRLLLVEVSDLVDLDFEDGNPGVGRLAVVDAVALVAEPRLDGGVVQLLNEPSLLDAPVIRFGTVVGRSRTHLALPAIESHPVLDDEPSIARLTWKLALGALMVEYEGDSLRVDLGVLVAVAVVQESELPVGSDLRRCHYSGMEASILGSGGEEDGVVLLDEGAEVGELLAERSLRLGLLGVLVVAGHVDGCGMESACESGRERKPASDDGRAGQGGDRSASRQRARQRSKRSRAHVGHGEWYLKDNDEDDSLLGWM